MTHKVKKPFHDETAGRILAVGEKYSHENASRITDLETNGLIEKTTAKAPAAPEAPVTKNQPAAPSNKDASNQRRNK